MKNALTCLVLLTLLCAPSAHAAGPLYYDKAAIDSDTTWSGTVVLRGQNTVKKGATLTIEPGTVVKFVWIDDDGDNIGDGELNVEGRIIARGTKDNNILFTSGQENPKVKDWTFLMISVNKDSLVEYCTFEYAFTGVQVHYSTATIRNNIFRNNFEGVRFSTTDVMIANNYFTGNTYGIRYESRGSKTTVTKNLFKGNEYAFFPVQKCSSTVRIFGNDILDCERYYVNMGYNQREELDYTNNWWGTTDPGEIASGMFDAGKDETLGRVVFEPFLAGPVPGCGVE
ncbi:MAG: right-handed parallel beta-helix repeat-containing protein [Nitrospirae bacterium]|nr:right-handed parallel beta-helix repeat-containing protein [Nitrospirota bacterium]